MIAKKKWLLIINVLLSLIIHAQNGASNCDSSEPMCSDNNGVKIFNNVTNVSDAGTYGCLFSTPNPSWFFIKINESGDLNFNIIQNSSFDINGNPNGSPLDVDFVAWGPFNSPNSNCNNLDTICTDTNGNQILCEDNINSNNFYINNLDNSNIIDCSYSFLAEENFTISNAQVDEYYILLITNFTTTSGKIKLEQTNFGSSGAGSTDCSIVAGELGVDQKICNGTTVTLDGTPPITTNITSYEWEVDTGSGYTTIAGETNATLEINNNLSGTYRITITDDANNQATDEVIITFYPVPIANPANDIYLFDTDSDGINSFDFQTDINPQVLGSQDANQFDVLYYSSQTDAINNTNPLPNPYTNTTPFTSEIIYVRIHNSDAPDACYDTTQFNLTISDIPNLGLDQIICNGTIVTLNGTPSVGNVTSYKWELDTGSGYTIISGQTNATLVINDDTSGSYKVTVIGDTGVEASSEVLVTFLSIPIANTADDVYHFDTDNDGFNSFDFQTNITPQILGSQNANDLEVLYFTNLTDANNNTNPLPDPYTNITAFTSETIYVRIHNKSIPNACYDISQFNLTIFPLPEPLQPTDYIVCDNDLNGGSTDGFFNDFLLSSKDNEILGTLTSYNISYHITLTGAETSSLTDVIDKNTSYRNIDINEQTIYVRIEHAIISNFFVVSDENSSTFKPFKIIVNSLPVVNDIEFIQCDTDFDSSSNINLVLTQKNISSNYNNETFKYYTSESDAIADSNEINNIDNYPANDGDIIWVRTISAGQCYVISEIEITISFSGNINYTNEFKQCDDFLDFDGNDTTNNNDEDGITFFDISSVTTDVKNLFPVTMQNDLEILIFESIDDRNILNNPITDATNYRNKNIPALTPQLLYIKIINKNNNSCEGLGEFSILTEAIPKFQIESPQILCLNNSPLVLEVTNDSNFNYSWIKNDNPSVVLSSTYQLDVYDEGDYSISIFDTSTSNLCQYTQEVTVIASNVASIDMSAITIIDDSLNNSITIDTTNLGVGNYEFALLNDTGIITDFQTNPYFENLEGGIYTIAIKDTYDCGPATEIEVSIIEFPNFFTPNNDGYNDTWSVKGASTTFYPNSSMNIFDRYGKQIAEISIDGDGWDGLYNGKTLPSNDYWYNIILIDTNGNKRIKKGHFSLLRK